MECSILDRVPDCLILTICKYLSFKDLQALAEVNSRLRNLRHDRFLVRWEKQKYLPNSYLGIER